MTKEVADKLSAGSEVPDMDHQNGRAILAAP